VKFSGINVVDK
jgi:hypothetical protein